MSINEVRYLPECGSTNAYVKEHFEEFGPVGAVYTENQTAGRGRLGRSWVNAEGKALYYTVAIREPLAQPATLPLLASLAVRRQLQLRYGVDCQIKWPNDLLLGDAKVGGMLIEEKRGVVLAGIGINVVSAPTPQALRQGWAVPAANLADRGISATPLTLWRHLVEDSRFCYEAQVLRAGGADFVSCAEKHLAWVGRGVVVHGGEVGDCPGRILGLEPQGGLRIVISGREHILRSGSITPIPS